MLNAENLKEDKKVGLAFERINFNFRVQMKDNYMLQYSKGKSETSQHKRHCLF